MVKKRISVSIEETLVDQLDGITKNRSGFIQALIEGALRGFRTFLVPKDYKLRMTAAPPVPPKPGVKTVDEFTLAGEAALKKRGEEEERKRLALTPEEIALAGAQEGVTSQLGKLFETHTIDADMASSDIREMQKEMFRIIKANQE